MPEMYRYYSRYDLVFVLVMQNHTKWYCISTYNDAFLIVCQHFVTEQTSFRDLKILAGFSNLISERDGK